MNWVKTWWGKVIVGMLVLFGVIQLVRFVVPSLRLDNPPVTNQVQWDSPQTEQLWNESCADCHSNETVYPWYAYIAPVTWLVAHDVHEGRQHLNVSTGHRVEVHEMLETISRGQMPMGIYVAQHPEAALTADEAQTLMDGLKATFGK